MLVNTWNKSSWRGFPIKQHPIYTNKDSIERVEKELSSFPPLVFAKEADSLKEKIAKVKITLICKIILNISRILFALNCIKLSAQSPPCNTNASGCPIVKVGRLAGQFAKPRSSDTEVIDGVTYPSYRGDLINSQELDKREPDPMRLLRGYHQSASTLNLLSAFSKVIICNKIKIP